jgi:hypothetical protein
MRKSDAKLSAALQEAGLDDMAKRAAAGHYNEFFGPLDTPMLTLIEELHKAGSAPALALRLRVMDGDYDADFEESEEWAKSEGGQSAFNSLLGRKHDD